MYRAARLAKRGGAIELGERAVVLTSPVRSDGTAIQNANGAPTGGGKCAAPNGRSGEDGDLFISGRNKTPHVTDLGFGGAKRGLRCDILEGAAG